MDEKSKKQKKVLRKIPPKIIKDAGQSSMRRERGGKGEGGGGETVSGEG